MKIITLNSKFRRYCFECGEEIFECMGSVHAGDFMRAMDDPSLRIQIRELCPLCSTEKVLRDLAELS